MKAILFFVLSLALSATGIGGAEAAPTKKTSDISPKQDCPINVASDKFTADLNAKTGVYSGNVVVVQCDTRLRADTVRITTVDSQANTVNASGNVVVESPKSGIATGQTGLYDVPKKMVTLTGNVVLKKGKDVMRGALLTVNLATGEANLGGAARRQGSQPAARVQAVFTPKSQSKDQ